MHAVVYWATAIAWNLVHVNHDFKPHIHNRRVRVVEEVCSRLQSLTLGPDSPFIGNFAGHHMTLTVCEQDRHFWSPWLSLHVTDEDGQTHVRGRFTPHPNIWTGFAFVCFTLVVTAAFAAVWGCSQWMIDQPPTALWVGLVCVLAVGLLWWVSKVGQRLARGQMEVLRDTVEEVLK